MIKGLQKFVGSNSPLLSSCRYFKLSMSWMTCHVPLGDPKHGGAPFLLPREIRDEIYLHLVKGNHLDTEIFYRYSGKDRYGRTVVRPDFAYSESVLKFVTTTLGSRGHLLRPDFYRMKRLAPTIQNVVLDVRHYDLPNPVYETTMGMMVQDFGGLDITHRSPLIRMFGCSKLWVCHKRLITRLSTSQGIRRLSRCCSRNVGYRACAKARWGGKEDDDADFSEGGRGARTGLRTCPLRLQVDAILM